MKRSLTHVCRLLIASILVLFSTSPAGAQGVVLPSAGPINGSMAGASVAAPIDPAGALYWNPATISARPHSELLFGADFSYPQTRVTSAFPANAFIPGSPPVPVSGRTRSDSGVITLPSLAWVHKPDGGDWTYGLGVFTIGGFGSNYPGGAGNPVFSPPPPNGFGLGPVATQLSLLQIAPTLAWQWTETVSIGVAPTVNVANLLLDPATFAAPDNANMDAFFSYPSATHSRSHWGLGVQAGVYIKLNNGWNLGASVKSPVWFETFEFDARDEIGGRRDLSLNVEYPLIVSFGGSYTGCPGLTVAVDVRYIDFDNADGLGDPAGFDATGASTGLGMESIFSVATGVQYELTDCTSVRIGYLASENAIPDGAATFNVGSPTLLQHMLALGVSTQLSPAIKASIAWMHIFHNSIDGPFTSALTGPVPGSSVEIDAHNDVLAAGISVRY